MSRRRKTQKIKTLKDDDINELTESLPGLSEKRSQPTTTSTATTTSSPFSSTMPSTSLFRTQPQWLILAIASGACAALNGVFAKLTTTHLTTTLSHHIHAFLSLPASLATPTEYLTRLVFFSLNLAFNAIMWALFTAALTRGSSTTRVSVVNTSANFLVTAACGWAVFGEGFQGLWFLGAALLVAGVVVIGRARGGEEDGKGKGKGQSTARTGTGTGAAFASASAGAAERRVSGERYRDEEDQEGDALLGPHGAAGDDVLELDESVLGQEEEEDEEEEGGGGNGSNYKGVTRRDRPVK